jgi:hypothetical protein
MLTHREIQEVLISLEQQYIKSYNKHSQDELNPIVAKWVLRDVNRAVIKKIKKKYDRS